MFKKGTKAYSIFHKTCPHCHEGQFFVDNNPYHFSTVGDLLDTCPVCSRKYTPEPGFYYGGMYVAYGLAVGLFVTIYVGTQMLYAEAPLWLISALCIAGLLILGPWLYGLSKIIWGNLFFTYKGVEPTAEELAKPQRRG